MPSSLFLQEDIDYCNTIDLPNIIQKRYNNIIMKL